MTISLDKKPAQAGFLSPSQVRDDVIADAVMPELDQPYAYAVLIAVVALACLALYRYLKKVRWL